MAKALIGHLPSSDLAIAQLTAENAVLRSRVAELNAEVADLRESLEAANAFADDRLVELVESQSAAL